MEDNITEIQYLIGQYQQITGHNPNYIVMDNSVYLQLTIDGHIQRHNHRDYIMGLLILQITDCDKIHVNYYDNLGDLV